MKTTAQDSFNHLMSLAQRSHQKGDLVMAVNLYKEALKVIPRHPDALQLLGIACCSQQKYNEGISYLEKALEIQPDNPVLLANLSNAYGKTETHDKALPLLQKSIQLKPDFDEAWYKLANTFKLLNRTEEAIHAYQRAIELNPNHANSLYNLGNTHLQQGNYKSAITIYEKCIAIKPDYAMAHNNLGIALLEWDRIEAAEQHYLKAVQLNPLFKEAIKNLCQLYEKAGKYKEAKAWQRELLKHEPSNAALQLNIETQSMAVYDSREEIEQYQQTLMATLRKALNNKPQKVDTYIEYNCYPSAELIYQGKISKEIRILYAELYSKIPVVQIKHKNEKCHVGFIVTSGHEGVFLKCMRGILNNIDTSKLDVSVVCSFPNGDKIIASKITNPAIKFVLLPQDFSKAQQAIVNAKIDILHYWEIGTDSSNYFLALTKPAPTQITSWGWPASSGLTTVDYFISQKELEPENGQEHYAEKLIKFDHMPVYYYRPPVPKEPKPLSFYGLETGKHLYICQQNLRKVHPDFDVIVKGILEKNEKGIILFIKDKQDAITQKLQKRIEKAAGANAGRIVFLDRMSEEDYLGLLTQCTIALDTLYYGGGANTIYDAVEAGIPVITMQGTHHSARFATAAFRQLRVTDTIVSGIDEYIKTAVTIADNKEMRTQLSEKLRNNSPLLFEDLNAVRELEEFLLSKFQEQ